MGTEERFQPGAALCIRYADQVAMLIFAVVASLQPRSILVWEEAIAPTLEERPT